MDKKTIKAKWLTELRSGNHLQVPGTLKGTTPEGTGYCCLGVLGEKVLGEEFNTAHFVESTLEDGVYVYADEGPTHFYKECDHLLTRELVGQLTNRNDRGDDFASIADFIEEKWETD